MPNSKTVLVVGGAGYIGSHAALYLKEQGYNPIVFDNFSMGSRELAEKLGVPVFAGDITNSSSISEAFKKFTPEVVMHFAAFAFVGESVSDPEKYYHNNVTGTLNLLHEMRNAKINNLIFSSTCATYGVVSNEDITEETYQNPINPYGRTKLAIEWAIKDFGVAYGLKSVILRYFNAAGAHPETVIGERHNPETHLLPLAINSALVGNKLVVFGNDYPTTDGTCIRDYIHVCDLASAHHLAAERLLSGGEFAIFNIGTGLGVSVLEVIKSVEKITKKSVNYEIAEKRPGDPPRLVASSKKLSKELGWSPKFATIDSIVETAVKWHKKELSIK